MSRTYVFVLKNHINVVHIQAIVLAKWLETSSAEMLKAHEMHFLPVPIM